jgi:putative SOS response-associated peptidase YedK
MPLESDLTRLALRTLEDALAQVEHGPIPRQWGYRLALTWLVKAGITQPSRCQEFWRLLDDPFTWAVTIDTGEMRRGKLAGLLDMWHGNAGHQPPDSAQRSRWAIAIKSPVDSPDLDGELAAMCNRYQPGERQNIMRLFDARELRSFNAGPDTVHPKDPGLIVRLLDGEWVLEQMTWGFPVTLIGKKGQPLKPKPVNNARFDKLATFWRCWAQMPAQRCLIPATRFAEAVGAKGRMTETWLSVKDQPIFAWAGLWRPSDEWGDCYTGVMTSNALELAHIHDRSPVILEPDQWRAWLTLPLPSLDHFDRPYRAERMTVDATAELWVKRN